MHAVKCFYIATTHQRNRQIFLQNCVKHK